ncbi:mandelate racemase/muconate lactonizing enzyme family protein [Aureobasidium subglaciale]|nr:mandelate racemase/muconate lactonizing enzyme family protein [Aureobasidium subglaciale]KAI5215606.1 mandelate racemase/muconate lactonizing enzyme family protein [Aureobasidium subglaciale]KAI5218831.1 mandelate racemase/muconate lactonizing enzyme family protein [Aureobasidium subglaciale]KAI5256496.1 mandelate racemase/muconate lactonizing enzyme family protein [Aureobasidium subglaciale]
MSTSEKEIKVLLFGLGAIGGFYAFVLGRNDNVSLSVVARSNYQQVKELGLRIESENHGNHKVNIDEVYKSPEEITSSFDYIVCTHKAVNPSRVPPLLENAVGDKTTFVIIQNGVGNEEPFRKIYPNNTIISCVTWAGATQTSPGLIRHTKSEDMQMGLFPNTSIDKTLEQRRLDTFANVLTTGNTIFQVESDIQIKRWEKVTWNAAWNSITTLTDVNTQDWLKSTPEAMAITKRLMHEVIDVANRCNVPLKHELTDQLVDKILAMPGIFSSMHTDMKEGRPLEVDVILGYPVRMAREHVKPRWLFVKITDEDGKVGWGEGTLEGHTLAVEGALDEIIVRLIGQDANRIEHIWQLIWRLGFYRGGPVFMSALSGIDIALWDLKARRLNVPIYELLGGKVREKCQVYCWIGGDRPADIETAARARKEQGLTCVKMNATEDIGWLDDAAVLDATVERLKIVKSLGLNAGLDFHGRLHRPMAKQLAKALEPYRPLFIEEPILVEHIEALKQLAAQTSIPIALGERLYHRWDAKPFFEAGVIDILQPDIAHAGGISETKRLANMAETYDVAIAPHCPLGPIAFAASLHIGLSTPNFTILEMSLGMHYNTEAGDIDLNTYLKDQSVFAIDGGHVAAPTGPGLGIEVDEEMIPELVSRRDSLRKSKAWATASLAEELNAQLRILVEQPT